MCHFPVRRILHNRLYELLDKIMEKISVIITCAYNETSKFTARASSNVIYFSRWWLGYAAPPVLYWINSKNLLQTRCLNKFNYLLDDKLYESFVFTVLLSDCYITERNIRKLTTCYHFHDWIFFRVEALTFEE